MADYKIQYECKTIMQPSMQGMVDMMLAILELDNSNPKAGREEAYKIIDNVETEILPIDFVVTFTESSVTEVSKSGMQTSPTVTTLNRFPVGNTHLTAREKISYGLTKQYRYEWGNFGSQKTITKHVATVSTLERENGTLYSVDKTLYGQCKKTVDTR
ncbi:hypothetical protein [Vibrio nigripulchritudo]|uniref:hypothetical protein n=2 Tax=Vibrio TaxID=662 RepID=UPI0003B1AD96|nr:hypothetical protein [Vibrio nigripulchritudo]CCN73321.1 hypothetical protein VIBNISFn118_810001 [Vibrio nigripulchritudo SFn118]